MNSRQNVAHTNEFQALLASCTNNLSRVQLFKESGQFLPNIKREDENLMVFQQNADYSAKLREVANGQFNAKKYSEALRGYNLAIAYAPNPTNNSSETHLAFAYANRAAVFVCLNQLEDAIHDIDLAVKCGYPSDMVFKLQLKRTHCEEKLKDTAGEFPLRSNPAIKMYKEQTLFKIQNPNPLLPGAEDFVAVQIHPVKGRQLVVTKDIPAGTVLIVEEPIVKSLHKELDWDFMRCHFCFKKISAGIPCTGCVFAMYCNDDCLTSAAQKYHLFECKTLPYLHFYMQTNTYTRMALRIICTVGPHKLSQAFATKDPYYLSDVGQLTFKRQDPECIGCDPVTGNYGSDPYLPLFLLASQSKYLSPAAKFKNTFTGIVLAEVLDQFTDYYFSIDSTVKAGFKDFFASVIIRHIECLTCNTMSLGETSPMLKDTDNKSTIRKPVEFAGALYAVGSLHNHSCVPNVTRIYNSSKGQMSVLSTLDLENGQELLTAYGRVYYHYALQDRQQYLRTNFGFSCDCIACAEDWPLLDDLVGKAKFCCTCPDCPVDSNSPCGTKLSVLGSNQYCTQCQTVYDVSQLDEQRSHHIKSYHEARQLISNKFPLDAIKLLIPCIQFFQKTMSSPNITLVLAQDMLKEAISCIVET